MSIRRSPAADAHEEFRETKERFALHPMVFLFTQMFQGCCGLARVVFG
jgi:hypothetical protein